MGLITDSKKFLYIRMCMPETKRLDTQIAIAVNCRSNIVLTCCVNIFCSLLRKRATGGRCEPRASLNLISEPLDVVDHYATRLQAFSSDNVSHSFDISLPIESKLGTACD